MTIDDAIWYIVEQMAKFVNGDIAKVKAQIEENKKKKRSQKWFHLYEWTQGEQEEFVKKMVDEIYQNTKIKVLDLPKNKRHIKTFLDIFVFNYGWKFKKGGTNEKEI